MSLFIRLRNWYRNWRNPVRLSPTESLHAQNAAYRELAAEMSGLTPVMRGATEEPQLGQRGRISGRGFITWFVGLNDSRVTGCSGASNSDNCDVKLRLDCGHVRQITGAEYHSFVDFPIIKCHLCDAVTDHRDKPKDAFLKEPWPTSPVHGYTEEAAKMYEKKNDAEPG